MPKLSTLSENALDMLYHRHQDALSAKLANRDDHLFTDDSVVADWAPECLGEAAIYAYDHACSCEQALVDCNMD